MLDYKIYKILFFGSSEFAIPSLEILIKKKWRVVGVVTQPDRPRDRKKILSPTPVKAFAKKKKLKILDLESLKSQTARDKIMSASADIAIVASYGQIIPESILNAARLGFINIHPSLLPKYRGPAPIQYAILNGERTTGISVMLLDDKMDHGPIIAQEASSIALDDDYITLHNRLAQQAAKLLADALPDWILGNLTIRPQDEKQATYTKLLSKEDGRIFWKTNARSIIQKIRAFTPWPSAWTTLEGKRVKITKAETADIILSLNPGELRVAPKILYVGAGNQTAIKILTLQPEGRKEMLVETFLRGAHQLQGKYFE